MPAETIFTTMTRLAVETGAVNLGQGFPDSGEPPALLEAAAAAIREGHNQYAPLPGVAGMLGAYAQLLRLPAFRAYCGVVSLSTGVFFAFASGTPV